MKRILQIPKSLLTVKSSTLPFMQGADLLTLYSRMSQTRLQLNRSVP